MTSVIRIVSLSQTLAQLKQKILAQNPLQSYSYLQTLAIRLGVTLPETQLSIERMFDTLQSTLTSQETDQEWAESVVFEMCQTWQMYPVMENFSLYGAAWAWRRILQDRTDYEVMYVSPKALDYYLNISPDQEALNGIPLLAILFTNGLDINRLVKNRFHLETGDIYPILFPYPPKKVYMVQEKDIFKLAQTSLTHDFLALKRFAQLYWEAMA